MQVTDYKFVSVDSLFIHIKGTNESALCCGDVDIDLRVKERASYVFLCMPNWAMYFFVGRIE